jgi:hypothetical protein
MIEFISHVISPCDRPKLSDAAVSDYQTKVSIDTIV